MHGLINRSMQCFLRDTYGEGLWATIAEAAALPPEGFEAMLTYDDQLTYAMLSAAAETLSKPRDALLEDLGIYLVSLEPIRRLLRFGGLDYIEFLHSLDELPDRARLAVADLEMPDLSLIVDDASHFTLHAGPGARAGSLQVFAGILRAMADDYGALALIEVGENGEEVNRVSVELLQNQFAAGRSFVLARPEVA